MSHVPGIVTERLKRTAGSHDCTKHTRLSVHAVRNVRRILLAADQEPRTAKDLSRICDASLATIYRRVSTLEEHDLVDERSTVELHLALDEPAGQQMIDASFLSAALVQALIVSSGLLFVLASLTLGTD